MKQADLKPAVIERVRELATLERVIAQADTAERHLHMATAKLLEGLAEELETGAARQLARNPLGGKDAQFAYAARVRDIMEVRGITPEEAARAIYSRPGSVRQAIRGLSMTGVLVRLGRWLGVAP